VREGSIDRAAEDARQWVNGLGPSWIARFDQMHCDVRTWAGELGVSTQSYEFKAAWCVATTFLHRMAEVLIKDDPAEADQLANAANILASVGLWGAASA
jgi:hypothetical protein